MDNLDDLSKNQDSIISNNYFRFIQNFNQQKNNTKKITCKEKDFDIINNHPNYSLFSNYNYYSNKLDNSKSSKQKINFSFQNTPNQVENKLFRNIYNNNDLKNLKNITFSKENINELENKDKNIIRVKKKNPNLPLMNHYLNKNNSKTFLKSDNKDFVNFENKENYKNEISNYNNSLHLIKSEKKLINHKLFFNQNSKTSQINEKSKKIFNGNINIKINSKSIKNVKQNILDEENLYKTGKDFFPKNQTGDIKKIINKNEKSKIKMEFSNKSTKIKNIFVKHKTQNKFSINNLKIENIPKKNDALYINKNSKSNKNVIKSKIVNNNNIDNEEKIKIINNGDLLNNKINIININNNINNKNYKISNQNKKKNFINIPQKKLYNITPAENILFNIDNNQSNNLDKIKICSNQIIVHDNKNIFIQNNFINGNTDKPEELSKENKKEIYPKNIPNDNTKKNNHEIIIKNLIPSRENIKNAIDNLKNILLGNNPIEEEKSKKIDDKKVDINNNKNDNNDDMSLMDESIIMNSSEVYGTLNFSRTINNSNEKFIKEKSPKNANNKNNKDETIHINSYSNYRDTITMNFENKVNNAIQKDKKVHRKILITDILNNNKTSIKQKTASNIKSIKCEPCNNNKNNKINYYKNFSVETLPGKNFGVTKINQDTPIVSVNINGVNGFNIFGVLDGHGSNGHYVSKFLGDYFIKSISNDKDILSCENLDKIYQKIKPILINLFLKADTALTKQGLDVSFSGTTCVLVVQLGKKLLCANVGDSRAILIQHNKKLNNIPSIFNLSRDFKPDLPEEKKRIYKMGGVVDQMVDMNGMKAGPPRVWGRGKTFPGLAMSRSLGDFKGKEYGIISLPEIIEYTLDENSKYMVISSDGVWEFLSNENVMEIGNKFYEKNDAVGFTKKLVEISEGLWEQKDVIVDDITTIVVFF